MNRLTTITRIFAKRAPRCQALSRRTIYGGTEGATAESKGGFSDKEKAVENQWMRMQDVEKLKVLRAALQEQKKTTETLKKELDNIAQKQYTK
ncbi:hypothetical protein BCR43DRAFT_515593 [Syncephalastrum racemosum]|uniref:ATPase inhibitor, mitochondrial n=1 Tax=Syncephalastrum racemosum TaxID=13706 RepID=A0A1X2H9Z4_SYNRA|nr:hypothetical protein BCR43DRAFT_515593 [Syncephalastrum racemosum]